MPAHASVLYPRREGATFDMKYYIDTHMPIVEKGWKPTGLLKWEIIEFDEEVAGDKTPYSVAAILTFKDADTRGASMGGPATKGIMDDIPNFSSEKPVIFTGSIVSQG